MFVYLSAYQGIAQDKENHNMLGKRLERCGWPIKKGQGCYTMDNGEVSREEMYRVNVRDVLDVETLLIIAKHYNQESILVQESGMNGICTLWYADGNKKQIGRMFHAGNVEPKCDHSLFVDENNVPNYYTVK